MNTSVMTVFLAVLVSAENTTPSWTTDYDQAKRIGVSQQKPLAVVIGSGSGGWSKVIRDQNPSPHVQKLLSENYVCVYVDTATPAGRALGKAFEINGNTGIVISDRTGALQAFWHEGPLTNDTMAETLRKHSNGNVVLTTDTINQTSYPAERSASHSATLAPRWTTDFIQARRLGSSERKSLAIVFGAGTGGWSKVIRDQDPSAQVQKLLSEQYVCVYIDTEKAAGKSLARDFQINGNTGIVISDRTGGLQAFWHEGNLTNDSMAEYLRKYSNGSIVATTETVESTTRTSYYPATNYQPAPAASFSGRACST